MIIDWQHHFWPEELYKKRGGKAGTPVGKDGKIGLHLYEEIHRIDKHLDFMSVAGIDTVVLSSTLTSVEECKALDTFYAQLQKDYPKQIVCLAPCIPTQGDKAIKELERGIDIGLKGTVISPQNDGLALDARELWPFYKTVTRLNVPVFVHITNVPVGYDALDAPYNLNLSMTREFDIAANAARLVLGGIMTEFPDLKIVMSHLGGGIASIMDRIERYVGAWGASFWMELGGRPLFGEPYKENFTKQFNKIYFDMAGFEGGMRAVTCALTAIAPEKLIFGTDYPYNFTGDPQGVRTYIDNIRKLDLPKLSIDAMLGGTARNLLGI